MGQSNHSFESSCDRLAAEFRARKDEPEFWRPVTELLREILAAAVARKTAAQVPQYARLLATWDVEALAQRLTDALPMAREPELAAPSGAAQQPAGALCPSALAAFLLLGFALSACDPGSTAEGSAEHSGGVVGQSVESSSGTAGTSSADAAEVASGGSGSTVAEAGVVPAPPAACSQQNGSALWSAIESSTLRAEDKQALYSCLVSLKSSWCDGLNDLFATRTPEQIASVLEQLVTCCLRTHGSWTFAEDFDESLQQRLLEGMLCPVTLYKGVSFPSE